LFGKALENYSVVGRKVFLQAGFLNPSGLSGRSLLWALNHLGVKGSK